ncbi:MAG: zinc ABC transporter ATP-binding protein [Rhodobiaceae bacterium]|mgnify:FL=1|nr:zinc ABC transporter ATP-binding protein [Rhodobiaceae bacterium]|tara:strand:- start:34631 stop:35374 length:744 start_codon:yes stop_codon:yes gene_type:complete
MSSAKNLLIKLDNIGIFRSDKWLIRGISLELSKGEIVTLVGPNGSGKTTTAKVVLNILKPDEGKMIFNAKKVAYLPQAISIDWTLPIRVRDFMNLTSKLSDVEVTEALNLTGVENLISSDLRNLSGGEFQRVLLARAIARKPDLLVLDEPAQGVDFNGEISLYNLIKEISEQLECGILLISHDIHFVMAATDQVICLNGHICCSGSPNAIIKNPAFVELFGARASSALSFYEHQHDHDHGNDGSIIK